MHYSIILVYRGYICMYRMVRLLSILPARMDILQLLTFCFKMYRQMSISVRRYGIQILRELM